MMNKISFAVKGLIQKNGKILILHKSDVPGDVWELPGGRMDFGETAEETLEREIKEETGYDVKPVRLLDTWNFVKGELQITGIIYLCEIIGGKFLLSKEHDTFEWVTIGEEVVKKIALPFKERIKKWDWESILYLQAN
ncbi:MAG: NUDIX domain-containing protein [Clostridiales bacterium]|nr:NUDIX domain-containing protein [Clostridiales bacterium]